MQQQTNNKYPNLKKCFT